MIHYIYLFLIIPFFTPTSFWKELNQSILGVNDSGVGGNSLNLSCNSIGKCKYTSTIITFIIIIRRFFLIFHVNGHYLQI
ncbi:MAG: hypothetical protein ACKPKO_45160 [Candidatus Fonsibacter sp.]